MRIAVIQRLVGVDAHLARKIQALIRKGFHEGFEAGHYADPDVTVTREQDEDNRWHEWQEAEQ